MTPSLSHSLTLVSFSSSLITIWNDVYILLCYFLSSPATPVLVIFLIYLLIMLLQLSHSPPHSTPSCPSVSSMKANKISCLPWPSLYLWGLSRIYFSTINMPLLQACVWDIASTLWVGAGGQGREMSSRTTQNPCLHMVYNPSLVHAWMIVD